MKFEDVKIGEMYRFKHLHTNEEAIVTIRSREDQGPEELLRFADELLFGRRMVRIEKMDTGAFGLAMPEELHPIV